MTPRTPGKSTAAAAPSPAPATTRAAGSAPSAAGPDEARLLGPALLLAALALVVTWAVPRAIGDLWVGLAAGRDIVAGRLGRPDDWAFNTAGRAWINQNWGAHLLTWLAWSTGGEAGLLALKALLIAALLGCVTLAARVAGAGRVAALVAAAGVVVAAQGYIDLRPNLFTLVMAPLVMALILRAGAGGAAGGGDGATGAASSVMPSSLPAQPRRIAWAAAAVVLWANLHGGFALGLLMLWLWAGLHLLRPAPGAAGATRLYLGAAAVATLLAGVVTPFGFMNLLEPFAIAGGAGWHDVPEWRPLWAQANYDSTWGFFALLGALALLLALGGAGVRNAAGEGARGGRGGRDARAAAGGAGPATATLFLMALALLTLAMAVGARRFVPLALVVLAPLVARALDAAARARGPRVLPAALAAVAVGALCLVPGEWRVYDAANPRLPRGASFFARMHRLDGDFPGPATRFIAANGIGRADPAGVRALVAWEWEGFVHLHCPQLKVMMGGRAQQIYTPADLDAWQRLLADNTAAQARALRIPLALLHAGPETYGAQVSALLKDGWAVLLADAPVMLLVDPADPAMAELLRRAEAGELSYPDERTRLASLTWLRFHALAAGRATPAELLAAARPALAAGPDPTLCGMVAQAAGGSAELNAAGTALLEEVVGRLAPLDPLTAPEGERALATRRAARAALATLYQRAGQGEQAAAAAAAAEQDAALLARLTARWKM